MRFALRKLSLPGLFAALGALALLAAGCGSAGPTGPGNLAKNQVFQYNLPTGGSGDIATMDPDITSDANSITVEYLTYDGLVELDQNLNLENWGAKKIDVSSDGLTYTFHLQANQKFANGTPVTSKNYAYSMDRSLNPCLASGVAYYLFEIKDSTTFNGQTCKNGTITNSSGPVINTLIGDSINTPDDQTLTVTLTKPAAYFEDAMTYPTSWAIDPTVVGSDITSSKWIDSLSTGVGTSGMFKVKTWDHSGGKIDLVLNPNWWGLSAGKKPFLTEIVFTLFKDSDTAYAAYNAGQFDIGFPTSQQLAAAKTKPDFHQTGSLTFYGITPNWTKAPWTNQDARIAMCLAINRDQINSAVLKNAATMHWNIVPKGMPGYNPNITGPDGVTSTAGDLTKAASHWAAYKAAAGSAYVGSFQYLYVSSSTSSKQLAEALQNMWQQALGVTVTLKGEDFNTWLGDDGAGNFNITRFGWLDDYPDPQDFLTGLYLTGTSYNSQKASVPAADTLMTQADANTTNQTLRLQQYQQAEQLLVNAVAVCPLYQGNYQYQVRQYVHGFTVNSSETTPLDSWIATYITNH